jgi:hypothetical protein
MPTNAQKSESPRLVDLMKINPSYQRSVQLDHDFNSPSSTRNFVATDFVRSVAGRINTAFEHQSTQRAWRITGDYGSGKSAFALSLLKAACGKGTEIPASLRLKNHKALTPVIAIGDRESLVETIGKAIVAQVPGLQKESLPKDNDELLRIVKKALKKSAGLFLVLDEMGKNLEHSMANPESADVYILQRLAEMASRSGKTPFVFLAILHMGVSSYTSELDSNSRKE